MFKLDHVGAAVMRRILGVLTGLTGWSNFRLARVALAVGAIIGALSMMRNWTTEGQWGRGFEVFWFAIDALIYLFIRNTINKAEEHWESMQDKSYIPFTFSTVHTLLIWRVLWFYIGAFSIVADLVTRDFPSGLFTFSWAAACYFAFEFKPPSKSLARRFVEAVKRAGVKAKQLVPAPQPVPIPVGVS